MKGHLSEIGYDQRRHDAEIEKIRKRGLTDISKVIRAVVKVYEKLYDQDAATINCGNCEELAHDVISLMGGESGSLVAVWNDELDETVNDGDCQKPSHCFIRYRGKYYDSETPEGVSEWEDLPIFQEG